MKYKAQGSFNIKEQEWDFSKTWDSYFPLNIFVTQKPQSSLSFPFKIQ